MARYCIFLTSLAVAPFSLSALPQWNSLPTRQPIVHPSAGRRADLLPLILPPTAKTSHKSFYVYQRPKQSRDRKEADKLTHPSRARKEAEENAPAQTSHHPHGIQAYRAGDPDPLWKTPIPCPRQPALLYASGTTAIFATGYAIHAANVASGELLWRVGQEPANIDAAGSDPEDFPRQRFFAADDDRLVAIAEDGRAVCLSLGDGAALWSTVLRHRPNGPPFIAGGLLAFPAMVAGRAVCCVYGVATGGLRRVIAAPAGITLSRVLITPGDRVLLVAGPVLASYDVATGVRDWQYASPSVIPAHAVVADPSGIYLSPDGYCVVKLDPANGVVIWQSTTNRLGRSDVVNVELRDGGVVVAAADEVSLIDGADGRVIARRALTGAGPVRRWEFTSGLLVGLRESPAGVISLLGLHRDLHGDRPPAVVDYHPRSGVVRTMVVCDAGFAVSGDSGVVSFGVAEVAGP